MPTVREQMAQALRTVREELHPNEIALTLEHPGIDKAMMERKLPYSLVQQIDAALDRARAEPEEGVVPRPQTHHREDLLVALDELFQEHYWDVGAEPWKEAETAFKAAQSELSCPDICDTSCTCYQEGLEAQREPTGEGGAP